MEQVRSLIERKEYEQALQCLKEKKNDSAEYYIYLASIQENLCYVEDALQTVQEGYRMYPDNYELVFMFGNYQLYYGEREKSYVQYLLAVTLCDTQDLRIIQENLNAVSTEELDGVKVSEEIQKVIKERIMLGEYEDTYRFVSDVVFSDNTFLFKKVIDQWIRYDYMILEITACERKRNLNTLSADKYIDCADFARILKEYKFAFRCIWFGFLEEGQKKVAELIKQYNDSADFWAVVGKCSVDELYTASVLEQTAKLIEKLGQTQKAEVLKRYANAFKGINGVNREVFCGERTKTELEVHYLDAEEWDMTKINPPKKRDANKISFILCANDESYVEEVLLYLQYQNVPENYRISVFVIFHAKSMAQGYNIGMRASDAVYKIYIHQDTFLFDVDFTKRLIRGLEDSHYQMLGVAGTSKMPKNGIWWDSSVEDKHLCLYQDWTLHVLRSVTDGQGIQETFMQLIIPVQCLDGVLIATSADVVWRDDLFTNFHFYDVSQTMEFQRAGYRAGVLNCGMAGVLHEVSVGKNPATEQAYEESRRRFITEYKNI